MLKAIGSWWLGFVLQGWIWGLRLRFWTRGFGFKIGIWACRPGFGPEARIWGSRLGFGAQGLDLNFWARFWVSRLDSRHEAYMFASSAGPEGPIDLCSTLGFESND